MPLGIQNNVMDDSLRCLWKDYQENASPEIRNKLFSHYYPWMRKMTSAVYARYRTSAVDWSDCVQTAAIALLDSIGRYNPDHGVPFEGFAYSRLRGSIINLIYKERDQIKTISVCNVDGCDTADEPGHGYDEFQDFDIFLDSVISAAFAALLDVSAQASSGLSVDPLDVYHLQSQEDKIHMAMDRLDTISRFIIDAHYMSFMRFKDIAVSLNVSASRVSQLHRDALIKLRYAYEKL